MVEPKDCLFCRIVAGKLPAKKVYEDQASLAFLDINPRNPGHTLVIPRKHYETIFEIPEGEAGRYFESIRKVAVMVKNGTNSHGLSVCQNNGSAAGQVVGHLHFHIIPRFLNEGPAALEAILPVKKMDDKSLDEVARTIKEASGKEARSEEKMEAREEKPKEEKAKPAKKKEEPEDIDEDTDEFEEIDFNF